MEVLKLGSDKKQRAPAKKQKQAQLNLAQLLSQHKVIGQSSMCRHISLVDHFLMSISIIYLIIVTMEDKMITTSCKILSHIINCAVFNCI